MPQCNSMYKLRWTQKMKEEEVEELFIMRRTSLQPITEYLHHHTTRCLLSSSNFHFHFLHNLFASQTEQGTPKPPPPPPSSFFSMQLISSTTLCVCTNPTKSTHFYKFTTYLIWTNTGWRTNFGHGHE